MNTSTVEQVPVFMVGFVIAMIMIIFCGAIGYVFYQWYRKLVELRQDANERALEREKNRERIRNDTSSRSSIIEERERDQWRPSNDGNPNADPYED